MRGGWGGGLGRGSDKMRVGVLVKGGGSHVGNVKSVDGCI